MHCSISSNNLIIKTKDGSDFWVNDDWIGQWELYFNVRNGIFVDTTTLTGNETPLDVDHIRIDDIRKYYYTEVRSSYIIISTTFNPKSFNK